MINANKPYFWLYEFKAFNQSAVLCTRLTIGLPALIQSVTDAHSFQPQTSKCLPYSTCDFYHMDVNGHHFFARIKSPYNMNPLAFLIDTLTKEGFGVFNIPRLSL